MFVGFFMFIIFQLKPETILKMNAYLKEIAN